MSENSHRILLLLPCTLALLCFNGCRGPESNPSGSGGQSWRLFGKTYFVGSTSPAAGILVKCAGMSVTSGPDGSYELRAVPEGSHTVTAEAAGCQPYSQTIDVQSDTRLFVYLDFNTTRLWGNVTNVVDGAVASAKVAYHGFQVSTDLSGRYEMPGIPWSTDTLTVTQPDYLPYRASLDLYVAEKQCDVVLKRERTLSGPITQSTYVAENAPYSSFASATSLLLSQDAYDSTGTFVRNNHRRIFIGFFFPELMRDKRVALIDGSLQLYRSDKGTSIGFTVLTATSPWSASTTTFNNQPTTGNVLLRGGTIGGITQYWTVLGTDGFSQLLPDWQANLPMYGIVIIGDSPVIASFSKQMRLNFKVRY